MFGFFSLLSLASLWSTTPDNQNIDHLEATANHRSFHQTISKVEGMVWDQKVKALARKHGLNVVNVTWEDTGRWKGSSVGPNISDMTIGVRDHNNRLHPMPVFRFDNFNDKTADIKADEIYVRTGNESGEDLTATSLPNLLDNVKDYLHNPKGFKNPNDSLLASRDTHFLVSAQACFLPIPKEGKATFTPVLYNYQSYPGNPAVMTIVATREGTSIQVVENDNGYMSEVLYFNKKGERAPFTATRLSDFKKQGGDSITPGHMATKDAGLNVVLVIQVPLKHKAKRMAYSYQMSVSESAAPMDTAAPSKSRMMEKSDVETAVIGHGETEGLFAELNNRFIERDTRLPVRVTAQFYKATSNGVVTDADVRELRAQIDKVYEGGDYVGSLVTDGVTRRPTEMGHAAPNGIWARPIWQWHKAN